MPLAILGKKIGMTRIYDLQGHVHAVTVIAVQGNSVLQVKTLEKEGYRAVQLGFDAQKTQRVTKAQLGHFKKSCSEPKRFIKEFRLDSHETSPELGDWTLSNFIIGQFVDIIGISKGKGFQGVVRRFKFAGQPETHGSMMHRRNGAIGNRLTPGRVWKNMGMPGHMGCDRITTQNLKILQVRADEGVILIGGAVPGAKGSYVIVRSSKKKTAYNSTLKSSSSAS